MQRKRLEDMNLLDDFLFHAVMTFPGSGERKQVSAAGGAGA